jgi:hypothetical protein
MSKVPLVKSNKMSGYKVGYSPGSSSASHRAQVLEILRSHIHHCMFRFLIFLANSCMASQKCIEEQG